jgi:hypothetical protein
MPNDTIHEEIEGWLAADLHQQLSPDERATLQQHLAGCATCHALHEENKTMHQLLEKTLAKESPGLGFEEKMVRRFREGAGPREKGLIGLLSSLIRLRATQVTALAAVLLALVQIGRMVTGEGKLFASRPASLAAAFSDVRRDNYATPERVIASGSNIPTAKEGRPQAKTFREASASSPNDSAKLDLKPAAPSITLTEQKQKEEPAVDEVDRDARQSGSKPGCLPSPAPRDVAEGRKLIRTPARIAGHERTKRRSSACESGTEEHGFSPLRTRASCLTESSRARSSSRLHPKTWIGFSRKRVISAS